MENKWNFKLFSRKLLFNFESSLKSKTTLQNSDLKQFELLKFLITFICDHCDCNSEHMVKALQDLENALNDSTKITLFEFSACWTAIDGIFQCAQEEKHPYFEFPEISNMFKSSKNHELFSPEETILLLEKIKKETQHSSKLKETKRNASRKKNNSKSHKSVQDKRLKTNQNVDTLSVKQCFERYREALTNVQLPETLEHKVSNLLNQKLVFLIDRITHLKEIFYENEFKIKSWWCQKETEKENAIYYMARRFYEEMDTRSSVEILFYDCSRILNRKDLNDLWIKINHLFTGWNMRDIIPQGNPSLETVGVLLGHQDIPSEVMQKSLELVEDLDALEALLQLWKTLKPITEDDFIAAIVSKQDNPLENLIINCNRWKSYLTLLSFS